jgi:hypothetical protein
MKSKLTISKQIDNCYEYVELAESAAMNGALADSNRYWRRATDIAIYLMDRYNAGTFSDEEYEFLKHIAKHIKDN